MVRIRFSKRKHRQPFLEHTYPVWIALLFAVMALSVSSCDWFGSQRPKKPALPLEKIIIAEGSQPIGALVYIALGKGYFKNEGLDVTLKPYTSGKDALNAVIEGKAGIATTAETPIVHAVMRGKEIFTIATIGTSEKAIAIIANAERGISEPKDIMGKKIGVSVGTNGEFFLDTFLLFHGVSKSETEIINLRPEDMLASMRTHKVDAVSTWHPHITNLQKELGDRGITFYGEDLYTWTWNLAVMKDYAAEHPETIVKVLRALLMAETFIKENPVESINLTADLLKIDREELNEQWHIYNFRVLLSQALIISMEDQSRWAIKNSLTDKKEVPNYLDYIYIEALDEVKPEAVSIIR